MEQKKKTPQVRFKGYDDTWEQRKLGDVVNVYDGVHKTPDYTDGGIMFLSVENISTLKSEKYISEEAFNRDFKVYPEKGDVLMTRIGDVGTPNVVETTKKVAFYVSLALLKPTDIDSYFLCNSILSPFFQNGLKERTLVTAIPQKINKDEIGKVSLFVPTSIDEQREIGAFFQSLDNLITLHQRKYDKLIKMKRAMLEKMFPKNGSLYPEIRFEGFTGAWEQRKLGDVVEFLDTMRKPLDGAKRVSGPYPYYGASGIVDYVDGYLFNEELVLLSEDGANITDRNYPVCFLATGKYWVNNHAHVLRAKKGNENNFICNSLERKDYTQYNTGMAMPKLNKETCQKIPISCTVFEEQKKIGDYFRNLDNLITLHQRKLEKLKNIKKACLEKMFV